MFPRELFDRARFDERLRYGSDEIDMARHLTSLGYTISYLDELYVHHHPSPANRDEYEPLVPANRLYTTTKTHLRYDRRPVKAVGYFILGSLHLLASVLRGEGGDARSAAVAIRTAAGYLVRTA